MVKFKVNRDVRFVRIGFGNFRVFSLCLWEEILVFWSYLVFLFIVGEV